MMLVSPRVTARCCCSGHRCYIDGDPHGDGVLQREAVISSPRFSYVCLSYGALAYSVFDLAYILIQPCVTNRPKQMTIHHIATIVLARVAFVGHTESLTAKCMVVEVNTLVLTIQKLYRIKWLQPFMLATWGFFRLLWYPFLTYQVATYYWPGSSRFDMSIWLQIVGSFLVLNALNLYWTLEFVRQMMINDQE